LGVVFLAVAVAMVFKDPGTGIVLRRTVAQPSEFGHFLFDRYWLAIEIVSLLFLVALVAILHLGKREGETGDEAKRSLSIHPSPTGREEGSEGPSHYKEGQP
jgi:hypothetical protein